MFHLDHLLVSGDIIIGEELLAIMDLDTIDGTEDSEEDLDHHGVVVITEEAMDMDRIMVGVIHL
jgi:hypothetical protein